MILTCIISTESYAKSKNFKSYQGNWSYKSKVGKYGHLGLMLNIKFKNNNTASIEVTSDYFLPLDDTKKNFENGVGKMRSALVETQLIFNQNGVATKKYKDEYSNGILTVQLKGNKMLLKWKDIEYISEYSIPEGDYILTKVK
jgi:hypothetical protein